MSQIEPKTLTIQGPGGALEIMADDEVSRKFAMLFEGQCLGTGVANAAQKYGYSRQRFAQIMTEFRAQGSDALRSHKRGPRTRSRRTEEVVREIIRYKVLDPDSSPEVIAQKLAQRNISISIRSVQRVFQEHGLQKKTLPETS